MELVHCHRSRDTWVCRLRVCCPIVSLSELVIRHRSSDIGFGVFGLMDPCLYSTELEQFSDVSFICIFPRYRPSVLVFLSRTIHSDYVMELVLPLLVFVIAFWLVLGYSYPLFICVADDMRLVMI